MFLFCFQYTLMTKHCRWKPVGKKTEFSMKSRSLSPCYYTRAHLLTTRCAGGGIPPSGRERALSEGAALPAGSGRLRPACVCCGTRISFAKRNKTMEVTEPGNLPHGIENRQPRNGPLRCGGVCLHELQPIIQRLRRRTARLHEEAGAYLAGCLAPTPSSTGMA